MYIAFGNRVVDSKDFINVIEENTEFKYRYIRIK